MMRTELATNNAYTSGVEMIQKMQVLMTERCGCIQATSGLIAPNKTRWLLVSFFWDGTPTDSTKQKTLSLVR